MSKPLKFEDELLEKATKLTGIREKPSLVKPGLEALIPRESGKRLAKLGDPKRNWGRYRAEDQETLKMVLVDPSVGVAHLRDGRTFELGFGSNLLALGLFRP